MIRNALLALGLTTLLFYSSTSSAQQVVNMAEALDLISIRSQSDNESIIGSPYLNDEWAKGYILSAKGEKFEIESLKYNVYSKNFEFLKYDKAFTLPDGYIITEFKLNGHFFVRSAFKGGRKTDFFQVLSSGKLSLLKRFTCELTETQATEGLIQVDKNKYLMKSEYYIQLDGEIPQKVKVRKDEYLVFMLDKAKEVKAHIKKNKLKSKKEEDLIKIFSFYNAD